MDILNFGTSDGISCNICGEYVIGSRFICLDCLLEYDDNSTDFCVQHFREYFVRKAPKCEVVHMPYHLLLQLRRNLAERRLFAVANSSRTALEKARARLGDHQDICNAEIVNRMCHRLVGSASTVMVSL